MHSFDQSIFDYILMTVGLYKGYIKEYIKPVTEVIK